MFKYKIGFYMSHHIRKQVGGFMDYDVENTFFLQKQNVLRGPLYTPNVYREK